jgi:hypothetical protein
MHTDENKKFDLRNIERNIKSGIITQKDYEIYLSRLPDVSEKLFNPEQSPEESEELKGETTRPKKKLEKKKGKGKK